MAQVAFSILLLIAARLAGYQGPRAIRMGCVVELLHTATLIHDDVVDQAPLRRGRPSANARWGDDASILVGDHLYSKSFALMVEDGDPAVLETLARATVSMTEAEVLQLERKRSGSASEADYLRIITQKTASFISACCRIGALLAKAPEDRVEALTRYGLHIGIAFQISDDSLDFVADQARLVRPDHPHFRIIDLDPDDLETHQSDPEHLVETLLGCGAAPLREVFRAQQGGGIPADRIGGDRSLPLQQVIAEQAPLHEHLAGGDQRDDEEAEQREGPAERQ